jgi:1,4-dihydroxy-2-naphthoyl-CoA hydrolase
MGQEMPDLGRTGLDGGTLASRMGIKIMELSAGRVTGTMPVAGNTQPGGLLHGGASCVLAETLGSLGAMTHAGPGRAVVGIEISATHHRTASEGDVTGVATLIHGGRTLASYEIVITDDEGRRLCTSRLTCIIRGNVPAGSDERAGEAPTAGEAARQ